MWVFIYISGSSWALIVATITFGFPGTGLMSLGAQSRGRGDTGAKSLHEGGSVRRCIDQQLSRVMNFSRKKYIEIKSHFNVWSICTHFQNEIRKLMKCIFVGRFYWINWSDFPQNKMLFSCLPLLKSGIAVVSSCTDIPRCFPQASSTPCPEGFNVNRKY